MHSLLQRPEVICSRERITYTPTEKEGTEIRKGKSSSMAIMQSLPGGHLPGVNRILLLLISLSVDRVAEKSFQRYK